MKTMGMFVQCIMVRNINKAESNQNGLLDLRVFTYKRSKENHVQTFTVFLYF